MSLDVKGFVDGGDEGGLDDDVVFGMIQTELIAMIVGIIDVAEDAVDVVSSVGLDRHHVDFVHGMSLLLLNRESIIRLF